MTVAVSLLVVLVALILTSVACLTLWWMLHAWRSPAAFEAIREGVRGEPQLSFSLIVPCRDESQEVMDETVRRLLAQDHPDFEVIISLGHDDLPTIAAAENILGRYPGRVRLSINYEDHKSKPVHHTRGDRHGCCERAPGLPAGSCPGAKTGPQRVDTTGAAALFVSVLSDAGIPVEEISRLIGHRRTMVTGLVYRHRLRPVVQTGATVMDRLFRSGGQSG